jgi:hypothetical protein
MIDATLHQVGRNARTQPSTVTTGAQDEEQQKRDYKDIRTSPATGRLQVEPGPAGNDLSTRHRSLEWQAMQFYG